MEGEPNYATLENVQTAVGEENSYVPNPRAQVRPTSEIMSIMSPKYLCHRCTEQSLVSLLRDPMIPREDKALSVYLFMFPYVEAAIATRATIVLRSYVLPEAGAGKDLESQKFFMAAVGLFTLGFAHSNVKRIYDQVSRRLKAACVSGGFLTLNSRDVQAAAGQVHWTQGEAAPVINDILGNIICYNKQFQYQPEIPILDLAPLDEIAARHDMHRFSKYLLEQMRVVYQNYHSSSIKFVPAIIDHFANSLGQDHAAFQKEVKSFRLIQPTVVGSPYIGLRAQLPEAYRIRNFPRLVYAGLLYHKRTLTDPRDIDFFKNYKVDKIKHHIPLSDQIFIEELVNIFPLPEVSSLVISLKLATLERGRQIAASKDPRLIREALDELRRDPNRGPWADEKIHQEDSAAIAIMVEQAKTIVRERIDATFEVKRMAVGAINDATARQQAQIELSRWKDNMEREALQKLDHINKKFKRE
ncbi:uncharacterized protein LOC130678386 [Microplitis mediator]|uniref:uncharacterized protein LOC130678386 n=1 Tax=Microplitis mediator TaxID=375433 RepID=UPI002555486D|nr:uncharacterized protein LOC130678386 [Microplitis mediator]XP_057341522.1 uncharacterized protein LOC130678386 [Microplitis mediator]